MVAQYAPIVEIVRLEEDAGGTFGALRFQKSVLCFTLELADRLNAPRRSCIPAQQYWCHRTMSAKFGETFEVMDVPGRTAILFHRGNVVTDTLGCILLGMSVGNLGEKRAVKSSGVAFDAFMEKLDGYPAFHLTIVERY
jgi:hypothetical protein